MVGCGRARNVYVARHKVALAFVVMCFSSCYLLSNIAGIHMAMFLRQYLRRLERTSMATLCGAVLRQHRFVV